MYSLSVVSCLIIYIFTAAYSVFILLMLMIILPLVSGMYTYCIAKNVAVKSERMPKTLIRGEKMKFEQTVINTAYVPVSNIYIKTTYKYNNNDISTSEYVNVAVKSKEKSRINKEVRLNYAGQLSVSTKGTYIADPLMLFKFVLKEYSEEKIEILPVLNEPDNYVLYSNMGDLQSSNEYSKKRKGDDTSEIFDLRGYVNGDSLNRIHWKLSAKEDELLVKDFSMPISRSNCILVELNRPKSEEDRKNLNGIYEMAYAIGNLACLKEMRFKLAFYSDILGDLKILDIISYDELIEAIRMLIGEAAYDGSKSLEYYMTSELFGLERLYYITDRIDDMIFELDDKVQGQSYIYVVDSGHEAGMITRLNQSTIVKIDRDDIAFGLSNTVI